MALQKLIINIQAKPFVASKMWHSWISIKGRHDKNTNLFISQWCTAIKRPFIIIHEGFCLIHFEQNTICLCVHTFGGQEGLRFCVRLDGFESISSLLTAQGHGSLWLCTASRFLLHAVFSLKAVLSQLSVPQSANAALALLTSQSSTCQPTHPHNPCTVEGAEMEKIKKKKWKKSRERFRKKRQRQGMGCGAKHRKQFGAVRIEKAKVLKIKRPLPLICTIFITSEGRHSHIAFHSLPHPWLQVREKGNFPPACVQASPFLMDKLDFWNA